MPSINPKNAGASRRRRAPWAAQPIADKRRAVLNHSRTVASASLLRALEIRKNGVVGMPREEKIALIKAHPGEMTNVVMALTQKYSRSQAKELVEKRPQILEDNTINHLVKEWCKNKVEEARKEIPQALEKRVKQYLKERKIPVDNTSVITAINEFVLGSSVRSLSSSIDLPRFERIYIGHQKLNRDKVLNDAHNLNSYLNQIVRGARFTNNQKKAVKRWLRRTLPEYHKKRMEVFKAHEADFLEAFRQIGVLEAQFLASARANFSDMFKQAEVRKSAPAPKVQSSVSKSGSREQRMAEYTPRVKEAERKAVLAKKAEAARTSGRPFNAAEYCLGEIMRENEATGRRLLQLRDRGAVNSPAIQSLYTAGSLAQKIFVSALDAGFEAQFGAHNISSLARAVSYIGSKGRIITHVEKVFQSKDARKIVDFLSREKLIELGHSGGDVVYLARSGTQK